MATAQILEEHITCSICMEILTNPHSLRCLHSFCLQCLQPLNNNGHIECPNCREKTAIHEIRRDFRIGGLVDSLYSETQGQIAENYFKNFSISDHPGLLNQCDLCERNPIVSRCKECIEFLCVSCETMETAHRRSRLTKNHTFEKRQEIVSSLHDHFNASLFQLEEMLSNVKNKTTEAMSSIAVVEARNNAELSQINKHFDSLIQGLEDRRNVLTTQVTAESENCIKLETDKYTIFREHKICLDSNIARIKCLTTSEDLSLLYQMLNTVETYLKEENNNIKKDIDSYPNLII